MSLGLLFWILMLLWLVGYGYGAFRAENPPWPMQEGDERLYVQFYMGSLEDPIKSAIAATPE